MYSDIESVSEVLPKFTSFSYKKGRTNKWYIRAPCAFDIETTTIKYGKRPNGKDKYIGFMYLWQFGIPVNEDLDCHDFIIIMGRYWEEFTELLSALKSFYHLRDDKRLVIYAHGLFFEFQFMRNFIDIESVFARAERNPIKVLANEAFEFRCSFYLSNMGLANFVQNTPPAQYNKLSGKEYNYSKVRTPSTVLTEKELEYGENDVAGLLEAVNYLLLSYNDNLNTIPLTSTGYVRREVREAVQENPKNRQDMLNWRLTPELYVLCKEAFRGGNSNSNPYLVGELLDNVGSFDRKSSYPAELMVSMFPVSAFQPITPNISTVESYIGEYAILMQIVLFELNAKSRMTIAYIPFSKCESIEGSLDDNTLAVANGRVVKAKSVTMTITDVDYKIIKNTYNFKPYVLRAYVANYGHVNNELRLNLLKAFHHKTELERGDPYLYSKFKNKINAYFGMFVTDICSPEIEFSSNGGWSKEKNIDLQAKLDKYYGGRNAFLSYQQGIWVTANARYRHQQGIDACGDDIVMGDTDSCKFIGDHYNDFAKLNKEWLELCENNDIPPVVKVWEEPTYMGLWNQEKSCDEYITLGAKKHAYKYKGGDSYGLTVAGLNKEDGAKWLNKVGIEHFRVGETVPIKYSGRTVAYYNDLDSPIVITVGGEKILTGSNIAVINATYTLGISQDYRHYLFNYLERQDFTTSEDEEKFYEKLMEETEYERID